MRIVFMGTPDYAAVTLQKLIDEKYDIAAVFAQPDKPVGRKQILTPPATKVIAIDNNIPIFQPKTLRDGEAYKILQEINPDVIVVVAYGKILPKEILDLPKYGCINGHASLLPKLRGASPIQWSIVTGETKTGVSTMLMDEGMDTGDILETVITDIGAEETAEELFDRLAVMGADLLIETLVALVKGELKPEKQNEEESTYAAMLDKTISPVDWSKSAMEVHNHIRGMDPWPVAQTILEGKNLKLFSSVLVDNEGSGAPGTMKVTKKGLVVYCGDSKPVFIKEVQYEGKKRMAAADFFRGHPVEAGTVLGK